MKLVASMPVTQYAMETKDVRATADYLVSEAKQHLEVRGWFNTTVYAVQAHKVIAMELRFRDIDEKDLKFQLAMTTATSDPNTIAVVCVGDCLLTDPAKQGKKSDCLFAVISAPGQEALGINNLYRREGKHIVWEKELVGPGGEGRMVAQFPETTSH